jgi:hypothetical protein
MGELLGIAGFQNTGKSYSRRYIPDGHNCVVIQPSVKTSYLYTGPKDEAIKNGTRKLIGDFEAKSPEGKFKTLKEGAPMLKNAGPHTNEFDVMAILTHHKQPGYFAPEHFAGNIIYAPEFHQLVIATNFVNKLMPWIHTIIFPDFTHFITEKITSNEFINRKYGNEAFAKYNEMAADAFRGFIKSAHTLRKDLVVVTEYHAEWVADKSRYELFLPGGQQMKNKFLPASYYDMLLFTEIKYNEMDDEAPPEYNYITRATPSYPEARSGGAYDTLRVPNNLHDALTQLRKQKNIQLKA